MKITKILELLEETVGQSYLYHMTNIESGVDIMNDGKLMAKEPWNEINDQRSSQYICLSRDSQLLFVLNHAQNTSNAQAHAMQLKINHNTLRQTHKLVPHSYFGHHHKDPERRNSKFYRGGLYMPDQWRKHEDSIKEKGPTNTALNRMESEEYTNKDIPINNKYIAEVQIYVTRSFEVGDIYDKTWCKAIINIIKKAQERNIPWTLYNTDTRRRIMDNYIETIKQCANYED